MEARFTWARPVLSSKMHRYLIYFIASIVYLPFEGRVRVGMGLAF
jgi:hypothetical protein